MLLILLNNCINKILDFVVSDIVLWVEHLLTVNNGDLLFGVDRAEEACRAVPTKLANRGSVAASANANLCAHTVAVAILMVRHPTGKVIV